MRNEKWEMRNEKWEMRNEKWDWERKCSISLKIRQIGLWINRKRIF